MPQSWLPIYSTIATAPTTAAIAITDRRAKSGLRSATPSDLLLLFDFFLELPVDFFLVSHLLCVGDGTPWFSVKVARLALSDFVVVVVVEPDETSVRVHSMSGFVRQSLNVQRRSIELRVC